MLADRVNDGRGRGENSADQAAEDGQKDGFGQDCSATKRRVAGAQRTARADLGTALQTEPGYFAGQEQLDAAVAGGVDAGITQ